MTDRNKQGRRLIACTFALLFSPPAFLFAQSEDTEPHKLSHFDVMPRVVATPEGKLVATMIIHRGPGLLRATPQKQDLLIQVSEDGGKTWSKREAVAKLPEEEGGFGFGESMIDRDGEIHVFLLCDGNTGTIRARIKHRSGRAVEPITRQSMDIWHIRSTDGRTKWTKPKRIWEGRAADLVSAIQLKSGRLLLPMSGYQGRSWRNRGEDFASFVYLGSFDSSAIYSDDGGDTWIKSPSVLRVPTPTITTLGAIEPVAIELNDGRVWMLIRTQLGVFYESFSKDGAEWSPATPTNIVTSDSPAGLIRIDEKRILNIWNGSKRYPYALGGRQVLLAAVSDDDGKTWQGSREVLRDPYRNDPPPSSGDHGIAMPFAEQMPDGTIVYSLWVHSGEGRGLYAFHPDWLLNTKQHDDFKEEAAMDKWSIFGCKGVGIVSADGAKNGKALSIAKTDSDWPTGAVRNFPSGKKGTITLRIKSDAKPGPLQLVLTDHFSPPFDQADAQNGVFSIWLNSEKEGSVVIPSDQWSDLVLSWDSDAGTCSVRLSGKKPITLKAKRNASSGLNYLRLRTPLSPAKAEGLLVDFIDVKVK